MNYWDLIKIKIFCTAKETAKLKGNQQNGRRYLQMTYQIKGYYPKSTKNLSNSTPKKTNNPVKKWAKDMNRHFSKEYIHMANRHMKRCSTSLLIREIQIKTTLRYHLTPVRVTKMNNSGDYRCWRGCGETRNPLALLVRMRTGAAALENSVELPQKIKNRSTL